MNFCVVFFHMQSGHRRYYSHKIVYIILRVCIIRIQINVKYTICNLDMIVCVWVCVIIYVSCSHTQCYAMYDVFAWICGAISRITGIAFHVESKSRYMYISARWPYGMELIWIVAVLIVVCRVFCCGIYFFCLDDNNTESFGIRIPNFRISNLLNKNIHTNEYNLYQMTAITDSNV